MAPRSIWFVDSPLLPVRGSGWAPSPRPSAAPSNDVGTVAQANRRLHPRPAADGDGGDTLKTEPAVQLFLERRAVAAPQLKIEVEERSRPPRPAAQRSRYRWPSSWPPRSGPILQATRSPIRRS